MMGRECKMPDAIRFGKQSGIEQPIFEYVVGMHNSLHGVHDAIQYNTIPFNYEVNFMYKIIDWVLMDNRVIKRRVYPKLQPVLGPYLRVEDYANYTYQVINESGPKLYHGDQLPRAVLPEAESNPVVVDQEKQILKNRSRVITKMYCQKRVKETPRDDNSKPAEEKRNRAPQTTI